MVEAICAYNSYLVQDVDTNDTLGLSSIQKFVVAIRIIGYSVPFDVTDEYTITTKNTAMENMKRF